MMIFLDKSANYYYKAGWCSWLSHLVNIVDNIPEKVLRSSLSLVKFFIFVLATWSLCFRTMFASFQDSCFTFCDLNAPQQEA